MHLRLETPDNKRQILGNFDILDSETESEIVIAGFCTWGYCDKRDILPFARFDLDIF